MKNSRIFDIIKKAGQAFVFNMGREQWLSDGLAAYSLAGLPEFSNDTLLCMLDKEDTFPITMNAKAIIDIYADEESFDAEISPVILKWKKKEYIPIQFGINEGFFIEYKYIKDFYRDYGFLFKILKTKNAYYLAVFDGMLPVAAVMPAAVIDTGFENRIGEISDIISIRMKEAVLSGAGESVPERNLFGAWQNISADIEQLEI